MPKRWLSIRNRQPAVKEAPVTIRQQDFDFALTSSPPRRLAGHRVGVHLTPVVDARPTTSSGVIEGRSKKLRIEVPSARPRTSEGQTPSRLQSSDPLSKSEDSLIGLAFGSPSHPPVAFTSLPDEMDSAQPGHTFRHCGPFNDKPLHMQVKSWKKIGALFKPKPVSTKRKRQPVGTDITTPEPDADLDASTEPSVPKHQWFKPRNPLLEPPSRPPPEIPTDGGVKSTPPEAERAMNPKHNHGSPPTLSSLDVGTDAAAESKDGQPERPSLPKLEINIPTAPLDRYSVMFGNLPAATRSSSLLARRSKALDSLTSTEGSRNNSQPDRIDMVDASAPNSDIQTPLLPPRRLSTPTTTRSPTVTKYSLFPPTSPAPIKIVGRVPYTDSPLKRSVTSPARLSPMQDRFPTAKSEPLNPKGHPSRDQILTSPDEITASTDREAPWSAAHSFQSSVSSATTIDEIFFDVKSFRDSKGMEDGQFVMTRPDSTAVQLARTRSKVAAAKSRRTESLQGDDDGDLKHVSVNTAFFEEAIATVERLASPSRMRDATPETRVVPVAAGPQQPFQEAYGEASQGRAARAYGSSTSATLPENTTPLRGAAKGRLEELDRVIPSPVPEVTEETSPKARAPKAVIPRVKEILRDDRPIEESPTIPQGPPPRKPWVMDDRPPPVPKKDANFIPISKYAAKSTVSAIERVGVKPARPIRAQTDSLAVPQPSAPRHSKERSATLPSALSAHPVSQTKDVAQRGANSAAKSTLRSRQESTVTAVATVVRPAPAAEVAVARTVSLSRKQSTRVLVPGPKLAARRAEAQASSQARTHSPAPAPRSHQQSPTEAGSKVANDSEEKDSKKWEIVEKRALSPVVVQAEKGHKPGVSMNLVVETI